MDELTAELEKTRKQLRSEQAERHRLEEALRQSEERNRQIVNAALDAAITIDAAGLITGWNTQAETIFGWSYHEVLSQPLADTIIPAQYRAAYRRGLERYRATGEGPMLHKRIEMTALRRDGREFPIELLISPLKLDGNISFNAFIRDITKRKRAEAELTDSEARYKAIVTTMPGAIYQFTSRNGVWTVDYVAPQVLELFGVNPEDVLQDLNNFIKHIHPDDLLSFVTSVTEAVEKLTPWNYEGRLINPRTGELVWWQGMSTPVSTTKGETIFNGMLLNITKRKQAEAELTDSEARYKAIVTTMPGAIYQFTSRNGVWTVDYMAPQTLELFGVSAEDFMVNIDNFVKHVYPDDLPDFVASVVEAVEKLTPWNYEGRLINPKTDEMVWWQGMSTPVATTRGEVIFNGILLNITERKQAEAALAQARDEALASSRLKTELLAKVSHELRTPLSAILGFAELLEMNVNGPQPNRQKQMVAEIIESTHYLASVVNELLDQAQLEAGRLELNVHTFAPTQLVDETLAKMSILAQAKGLSLIGEITPDLPTSLMGDEIRLQQILVNLLSNAIKFTAAGTVRVRLFCPKAQWWAFQVADTGSGIPLEAQNYIFEPFRQMDGSVTREQGGTGLGLSIVKQLVILMGGEITIESAVGQGSTFTIVLPLQSIEVEAP